MSQKQDNILELLEEAINLTPEYRETLNLDELVTFGIEIEYERMINYFVDRFLKEHLPDWKRVDDISLLIGGEINSPILTDTKDRWEELKTICEYLRKRKVVTSQNAGGHIHIGAHLLGQDVKHWQKFLKTYMTYESIIFRFLYGERLVGRKSIYGYAEPLAPYLKEKLNRISYATNLTEISTCFPLNTKYKAICFDKCRRLEDGQIRKNCTVEFRSPNGTVNEIIWQNNINLLAKLILATGKDNFDEELVDHRLNTQTSSLLLYEEIDIEKAVEFANLIFENEDDKLYFLNQYLKGLKVEKGFRPIYSEAEKKKTLR